MLLISAFIKDYAYKPIEHLFIGYCICTYLKETYQLEDEVLTLQEELKRQCEQLVDIAKKNDCNVSLSYIISHSYGSINPFLNFNKKKYIPIIVQELKKLNEYVYIVLDSLYYLYS